MPGTRQSGQAAEDLALAYLSARGLSLVARNFRCRRGEIDLVMRDGDVLVFVEVRLRSPGSHAGAAESIDARKQRRIVAAAGYFLAGKPQVPCRFDAVVMDGVRRDAVRWIRAAFEAQ